MGEIPFTEEEVKGFFEKKVKKIERVVEIYNKEIARGNSEKTAEFIKNKVELMNQLDMYSNNIVQISTGEFENHFRAKHETPEVKSLQAGS